MKIKSKWIWIAGGALIIVAALAMLGMSSQGNLQAGLGIESGQTSSAETVTAFSGSLSSSASASGQLTAQREAALSLTGSGTVGELYVEVGDRVENGQPLLSLELGELDRAVEKVRQSLLIQESNLASLLAPASEADIVSAQAAVASAQAELEDLMDGPGEAEIAGVEADLRAASADLAAASARLKAAEPNASAEEIQAAQVELELAQKAATQAAEQHSTILVTEPNRFLSEDRVADMELAARQAAVQANADLAAAQEALDDLLNGDSSSISGARAAVSVAVANRDAAQARLDLLLAGPTESQLAAAQANLTQAQANLEALLSGPSEVEISMAQIAVEQARLDLEQAEMALEDGTLVAPFSGTVTAINVDEGELTAGTLIELVDMESLELLVEVDEVDVADLAVGQQAAIRLESWPDEALVGTVVAIGPQAKQSSSALVVYEAYLKLEDSDLPLLAGMTADAELTTSVRDDLLLVPNQAINVDRTAGTYSVNRVTTDAEGRQVTEVVQVTVGLSDGQYTHVTSGLQPGDELIVGNQLPIQQFGPGDNQDGPFRS